ncbi:MAG TPA: T9SS type A sorting domain-containing protein [Bacteroidia bacterium]|nr:T9SS type A sorting domain-containing protein [Bacteroidia bacterium]
MKKIICLLLLVSITTFSKATCGLMGAFHNFNQNTNASLNIYYPFNAYSVLINYGDSAKFRISAMGGCFPPGGCDLDSVWWIYNGNYIGNMQNHICEANLMIYGAGFYTAYFIYDHIYSIQCNFDVQYNPLSAAQYENINFLNVFPTAVNSSITIQLNSIKPNDIEISFYDMHGRQLKNDFYKNIVGEFIKNENTEGLAKGTYFLRIKSGKEMMEKKFVKM